MQSRVAVAVVLAFALAGCLNLEAERRQQALAERDDRIEKLSAGAKKWTRSWDSAEGTDPSHQKDRVRLALQYESDSALRREVIPVPIAQKDVLAEMKPLVAGFSRQSDAEALTLAARWKREVDSDLATAVTLACRATELDARLFEAQVTCGDCVLDGRGELARAIQRWRVAYPLAKAREEQCQVVDRVATKSLRPEEDMEEWSPAVIDHCRAERAKQAWQGELVQRDALDRRTQERLERLEKLDKQQPPAVPTPPSDAHATPAAPAPIPAAKPKGTPP